MFKHNYIQKLAFDNVRKQKKFYKFLFTSLILIFGLSTMVSILLPSFEQIGFRERYSRYGLWSVAIPNPTEDKINLLKSNQGLMIGHIYNVGDISYKDKQVGSICSLDNNGVDLAALSLVEGRVPLNNNEIMIAQEQFLVLGIPKQINQDIELSISNDKTITKTYKIVGIVKDFMHIYPIALSSYLTVGEISQDNITLLSAKNNVDLWNYTVSNELQSEVQLNHYTYNNYSMLETYKNKDGTVMFRWFVIVLGFAGVIGTMASAMSKRTGNFVLMRAIGATSKQIQKMIVYEGVFLSIVAGIVGIIIGLLVSLGVLSFYCSLTGSDFIFILNSIFYLQIGLSFITSLIAIFIPTFKVDRIPLVGQLQQKVKAPKKRKIRKVNIFSLGVQEFTQHKIISVLLMIIIFMGIMVGELFTSSLTEYISFDNYFRDNNTFDYSLEIHNQKLSTQDIKLLTGVEGITSQVFHGHNAYLTWDGIEKEESAMQYRSRDALGYPMLPQYSEMVTFSYYENEKMLQDIFDKYSMQGRLPKNDNEVVIFKPFMQYHANGMGSSPSGEGGNQKRNIDNYVQDKGLEIGDYVYAYNISHDPEPSEEIKDPFKIVGIFLFENEITRKETNILMNRTGYNIITNSSTYHKYFKEDSEQSLFFDVNDKEATFALKKEIYNTLEKGDNIYFHDGQASQQNLEMVIFQSVLSTASFSGIFFIGIVVLTYLYRKVKLLSMKHEIGLYRAIGMTNKQLLASHAIYGGIIYLMSVVGYIGLNTYFYNNRESTISEALSMILTSSTIMLLFVLGIGFILAIMLPVYSELKENILDTISKE